jgi:hypothetical protein
VVGLAVLGAAVEIPALQAVLEHLVKDMVADHHHLRHMALVAAVEQEELVQTV